MLLGSQLDNIRSKLIAILLIAMLILSGSSSLTSLESLYSNKEIQKNFAAYGTLNLSNPITQNVTVGSIPWGIAYDPKDGYVFVGGPNGNSEVAVIDSTTSNVVSYIQVGGSVEGLSYDPNNDAIYVADFTKNIAVISGSTLQLIAQIPTNYGSAWGTTFDPANGDIYVTYDGPSGVTIINGATNQVTGTLKVGNTCNAASWTGVYDANSQEIYLPDYCDSSISVINAVSNTMVTSIIPHNGQPYSITYNPSKNEFYVLGNVGIGLINGSTNTVIGTIGYTEGTNGYGGITYDPTDNLVFAAMNAGSNLMVVNSTTDGLVTNLSTQSEPLGVLYDSQNSDLYVANYGAGTVSIISFNPPTKNYQVNFSEDGMAPGLTWSTTFGTQTKPSGSGTISFVTTNGTFPFSVQPPTGYAANPSSSSITVAGKNITNYINISPTVFSQITFSEQGLSSGLPWTVHFNGVVQSSVTSSLQFSEPNGNFGYSVTPPPGYTVYPTQGSIDVNGPSTTTLVFTPVTSIGVGQGPQSIAYDSNNGDIYVANLYSGTVSVINGAINTVSKTISVGTDPTAILYDPANKEIYVANSYSNNVSVISDSTNQVVDTIPAGTYPSYLLFDSANGYIYVSNNGQGTVTIINGADNSIKNTVSVGQGPQGMATDSSGNVYVANSNSYTISVISASSNSVTNTVTGVYANPSLVAYDSANSEIYAMGSDVVYPISNYQAGNPIQLSGGEADGIIFANNSIYVADGNTVSVISGSTLTPITVGTGAQNMLYDPNNNLVYVANYGGSSISVISSSNTVVSTITVGSAPANLVLGANNQIYSANFGSSTVSAISGQGSPIGPVVSSIQVSSNPTSITINGQQAIILATVLDQNNNPVSGVTVSFYSNYGSLSATDAITNNVGQATTTLSYSGNLQTSLTSTIIATALGKSGTTQVMIVPSTEPSPPTQKSISLSPACTQELSVQIYAIIGSESSTTSIVWNWGDGSTSTGAIGYHVYSQGNSYPLQVTASYSDGSSVTTSTTVSVSEFGAPSSCEILTVTSGNGVNISVVLPSGSNLYQGGQSQTVFLAKGTPVTLTAEPSNGFSFDAWIASNNVDNTPSGEPINSAQNSITFAVNGNGNINAVFASGSSSSGPLSITTISLPGGEYGSPYPSSQLEATGGAGSYVWSIASSSTTTNAQLEELGLSLSSQGVLSGTPYNTGPIDITVQVQDKNGNVATESFPIQINTAPTCSGQCLLPNASPGKSYLADIPVQGGTGIGYVFTLFGQCCFPPGLTLESNGGITGVPTSPGTYSFVVKVQDSIGGFSTIVLSITVPPVVNCVSTSSAVDSSCSSNGAKLPTAIGRTDKTTVVYIYGTGFSQASSVYFGNSPATSFTIISDSEIEATAPELPQQPSQPVVNATVMVGNYASSGACTTFSVGAQCYQFIYISPQLQSSVTNQCNSLSSLNIPLSADATIQGKADDESGASAEGALTVTGSINLTGSEKVCITYSNFDITDLSKLTINDLNLTSTLDSDTTVSLTAMGSFYYDNDKILNLGDPVEGPIIDIQAGPVPIVIVTSFTPVAKIEANLEGDASTEINQNIQFVLGADYTPQNGIQPIHTVTCENGGSLANACFINMGKLEVNGHIVGEVGVEVAALFYDMAGPAVTPYAYLEAYGFYNGSPQNNIECYPYEIGTRGGTWWDLCGGVDLNMTLETNPVIPDIQPVNLENIQLYTTLISASDSITTEPSGINQVSAGQPVSFVATIAGGSIPASWSVSPTDCGTFAPPDGPQTTFTASNVNEACKVKAQLDGELIQQPGTYFITVGTPTITTSVTDTVLNNGAAVADQSSTTGITTSVFDSTTSSNTQVTVSSEDLPGQPPNVDSPGINPTSFYDVQVTGTASSDTGSANICITSSQSSSVMQFYYGGAWYDASNISSANNSVCGNIPVFALGGTSIALGTNTCTIPTSGDWTLSSSCTLSSTASVPANVIVQSGTVLTIPSGMKLNIDFTHFHLLVRSGGGVLIKSGGAIN